jgi:NAD(P)-dependent dehydrogenase (short-subunit alcohol dehydrogenase family)
MGLFDGKVAIVTGAGRGIGREEAVLLAAEGASVVVNDVGGATDGEGSDAGPAQQVVDHITAAGGTAIADTASVADFVGAEALVTRAFDTFGRLDVLVNNAGILRDAMSFKMTEADWDSVIAVHLKGHFNTMRHASARWREQAKAAGEPVGATVVNTASESGLYGNAGQINYAAAKAGIASMTIVAAREYERFGVRVNAIAPVARTRLTEAVAGDYMQPDEDGFDRFSPDNVAGVAGWLASDLSRPLSGQVIKVQGGLVQRLEGWKPATSATATKPWTIDEVEAARADLLGDHDGSIPPFLY